MSNESKSLKQRHNEWIDIVNRGDVDAYAELLTEAAVWIPPSGEPIVGREAFREWLASFFSRFSYNFSITNKRLKIFNDRAIGKGEFTTEMIPKEGGKPMRHSGTFMVLWYREGEHWYIERYIDDTDL